MNNAQQREDRSKSYAPQDRPEIIVMAQKARFQSGRAAKVKTDGDGTYIDGIPPLKWGQWRDCVYSGAIEVLLGALGIPASYEHIAGLSGSAYRFGDASRLGPVRVAPSGWGQCRNELQFVLWDRCVQRR